MFHRLGHFVVKRAWWVIAAWLVATVALVAFAPKMSATTDEADFLPKHYEAIRASAVQEDKFPAEFSPGALLLFERTDGGALTDADQADIAKITKGLGDKQIPLVQQVVAPSAETHTISQDGRYAMGAVAIDKTKMQTDEYTDAAKDLRTEGKKLTEGTALKYQVGGQAAMSLDQKEASSATDAITFVATVVLVVGIVGVIFRGLLVGFLPVLLAIVPMLAASGLISTVTKLFDLKGSTIASAIQIVVILGVGTDYFLFLMFRYRERLRAGDDRKSAVANGIGRVGEAIASAAGAVTVAFAVLLLSELGMFTSLGPALAISVVVTALASLTLFPAVLAVIPAKATFWPGKKWMEEPKGARFHQIGKFVGRRPGVVALVSGGLLAVLSLAGLGYQGTFDMAKSMMPKDVESMVVLDDLGKGGMLGGADPTHVFLTADGGKLDTAALDGFGAKLGQVPGVSSVDAEPKLSKDGSTADFKVSLKDSAASNAAIDTVTDLRSTAHAAAPSGSEALVGGTSSIYKDINLAMTHDYKLVFPVAGVLILLILGLQLRSVVAPWYLMASVGLGFAATLGATTLAFLKIGSEPGLMFMLPIFIYLFVVAIGTDYNILIIARLREEAREGRSPRKAAEEALRHAGPTVAAAGFILAASFATFMLAGNVLFAELGFALSVGIALAAFVMAMFFTPSITALLGKKAWWPGHGAMPDHGPESIGGGEREPEPAGRA
ncbi:MMPL family transporter [Kitasatospora cineracea]|uniref:RND superfamily putative drug exporter n=1 Tax=Kitasatospora cineracea TaxID=88074 RepID=A0A8G1XCP8_9ACTN|nr:MMPL family transporter [Kitasatospora cineracea]ROR45004.1 RND superfamily putative drug exporter [Kitasatospora cineracea]